MNIFTLTWIAVFLPLLGSVIAGIFRNQIGRVGAHTITIGLVSASFFISAYIAVMILGGHANPLDAVFYTWASGSTVFPYTFHLGFLVDSLTAVMLVIVTFVSTLVHIYSIGYMADDDGYQRFFSYISLFTFMMLMLVTANNFLQLFFGWEGVGLVSYLLIGFYYKKDSALQGSLKAFLVNRVGDFGFILGIALIFSYVGSLDYDVVFKHSQNIASQTISLFEGHSWSVMTVTCLLLFVGAMGKSAQMPLHVWLPESMEGPTPISALIHAATMVTAGVFMLARISPLIELSDTALSVVLFVGASGALYTGILGIVMNDIKRVIAYSTLSQLGYMIAAMGASAFSAGMFHLLTHACFKALLFLAAGSVIISMHHEQDMRKMGGLWRKMPITYLTFLIGGLALSAVPPFAGFYSKDTIIEAISLSHTPGSGYAYVCVALGAMVTAIYTFRALFMTFHGKPRMDEKAWSHAKESPWVVCFPLIMLAIPSVVLGYILYMPILFDKPALLSDAIFVLPSHDVLLRMGKEIVSPFETMIESVHTVTFWLTMLGIFSTWVCYILVPSIPGYITHYLKWPYRIFVNKYGFDLFNDWFFVRGAKGLGCIFYRVSDQGIIEGFVNGLGRTVTWVASRGRNIQSGYVSHYILVMVFGLIAFLSWLLLA